MDVSVKLDWISVTSKTKNVRLVLHPVCAWVRHDMVSGGLGYDLCTLYAHGVRVYTSSTRDDMGVHIQYGGQALKNCEDYGYNPLEILRWHMNEGHRLSRIDIAIDICNSGLKLDELRNEIELGHCIKNPRSKVTYISTPENGTETIYIGSMKSRRQLVRIYNKAVEQGKPELDWIRFELELRERKAWGFAEEGLHLMDFETTARELIAGICAFPRVPQYVDMVRGAYGKKVHAVRTDESKTMQWLLNQCAPSLARVAHEIPHRLDLFMDAVNKHIEDLDN